MTYEEVESQKLKYPESNFESFKAKTKDCFKYFIENNSILKLINDEQLELKHYHKLLLGLFHQVYMSSSSFALAGAMEDSRRFRVREYFLHHAEEEQHHWKWIIQNLRDTNYSGQDPRELFPTIPTQAYISFAMYLANKQPVARLAMGYILEGISGEFGLHYGMQAAKILNLNKEQMSFFVLHGELDKGHSNDILEVLKEANLSPYEWAWCEYAAECTTKLYCDIYNSVVEESNLISI
jgi:hypothetical protein